MELFNFFKSTKSRASALEFKGQKVEILRKPYQKTLRLNVHRSGKIRVSCRVNTLDSEIFKFLVENETWLTRQITKIQQIPDKKFVAGEEFSFLGRNFLFNINYEANYKKNPRIKYLPPYLQVRLNLGDSPPDWRKLFRMFYKRQAKKFLPDRLKHWADIMGLQFSAISIRGQRSRWGSCSHEGGISLNYKLMIFSLEIIDYVLIHELAHIRHPNHSSEFWSLVQEYCSDFRAHRKSLRTHAYVCDFLDPL